MCGADGPVNTTVAGFGADLGRIPVHEAMTKDLVVCVPDDEVDYAMGIVTKNRVRHDLVKAGKSHWYPGPGRPRFMLRTPLHECRRDYEPHDHRTHEQERVEEHGKHLTSPCSDGRIAIILLGLKDEPNGPGEPLAPRKPPPPV